MYMTLNAWQVWPWITLTKRELENYKPGLGKQTRMEAEIWRRLSKRWIVGSGRWKASCFALAGYWFDCTVVTELSFVTELQSVAGGYKSMVLGERIGKTYAELSHLLQLSETQGRIIVPEGSLFTNKTVR